MTDVTGRFPIEGKPEWTPEEAAMLMRLRVFVTMRWLAIVLVLAATLVASFAFRIRFPTLPVYVICGFIIIYNVLLMRQVKHLETVETELIIPKARTFGYLHITLDLISATFLLHFSGGIENPFVFLFVLHIISASIVLNYRVVYLLATIAVVLVVAVAGLEYAGILSHVNLEGFAQAGLYRQESYIVAIVASFALILYVTAYMATAISGELRKRQRQVVQLRERLLEERTGELKQASAEIAKLEEERSRFLRFMGIAAHDLKAPLTAIQGYLWLMLGGYAGQLTDKQRNMMDRSATRITELLTLISDLLDIPRIETGQILQEVKELSLDDVINSSIDDWGKQAEAKGLTLNTEVPATLPMVKGSAPRLKQVINNLLNNAISYTPQGSVTVRVKDGEDCILCEVIDTGIGIPPEEQPRLFEDFFRASNVDKKGTGLGLSIARRIVEAHGGKIWAESPPAGETVGSKFSFTLPKVAQEAAT